MPSSKEYDLSAWYAQPLTVEDAKEKLEAIHLSRKQQESDLSSLRIEEVIARYWLGREVKGDVENYQASYQEEAHRALITMIYGQLLMSKKREGAMGYLDEGFRLATSHFLGAGYLEVMRRHDQLRHIVLTSRPVPGLSLNELLQEAGVIKKLKGKVSHHRDIRADNTDTLG